MNGFRDQSVEEMETMFIEMKKKVLGDELFNPTKEWKEWKKENMRPLIKIKGLLDCEFMTKKQGDSIVESID